MGFPRIGVDIRRKKERKKKKIWGAQRGGSIVVCWKRNLRREADLAWR